VFSQAVVIATGVSADGRREVLGSAVGDSETQDFWTEFLRGLRERGLHGVQLVISDHHRGLMNAIGDHDRRIVAAVPSSFYEKGGLHLDTPRHDFPAQDLKYAKAVRVDPRPGWAVAAVLRVPVAAPAGSVRPCATTGRLQAGLRPPVAGACGTAGRGCVSAVC
jgi:hypothetical protein